MTTKERILQESLDQFNSLGVEDITTRHIAKALGMSQGNLHYHFPTKNVLILVLFEHFKEAFQGASHFNKENGLSKEQLVATLKESFGIMHQYRFFFKDNEVVWRKRPEIKDATIALLNEKRSHVLDLIQHLKAVDAFREDMHDEQASFLADQFIFVISSWLTASGYMSDSSDIVDHYVQFTLLMWLPYLTPEEAKKWG